MLLQWDSEWSPGLQRLQTELRDRFLGYKEVQAIMRAQPVLTTVLPVPPVLSGLPSPHTSKFDFSFQV